MTKKIFTILIILCSFSLSRAKADIIIQTTDVTFSPGTEFTVPIKIYGASDEGSPISSANIVISFDTAALQYLQLVNFNPITPSNQWFSSGNNNTGLVAANWLEPNLLTVSLPDGSTLYEIKFKAKPGACALTFITYEFTDANYDPIPTTPDDGSYASIQQVIFQVDMRDQAVSSDGVHLAGTFNNWSTTATTMTSGGSTIYTVTLPLVSDSAYYFRYVNGNTSAGYEIVPAACGVLSGNSYNRVITPPAGDTLLPAVCFSSCSLCPPQANVTFQVDMRDQFVSPQGVHLAGSFNGWSTSATAMSLTGSSVYSATLTLLSDSLYTYKFVNGNSSAGYEAVPSACGIPSGNDYARYLSAPVTDSTLNEVCFSSCDTCPPQVQVTFRVDMSEQSIDANGVHIAGTFNNWNPSSTVMNNLGNYIFGVTVAIVPGTEVQYRFVNGNTTGDYEVVPSYCGVPAGGGLYNRLYEVADSDSTLMAVCFSNCSECLSVSAVTFKVDMSKTQISANGIHLAGSFNGFSTTSISMTNQGNDVFIATLDLLENELITYRFVNGNDASGFETVPPECGMDNGNGVYNRYLTVPGQDTILNEVCFSSCEDCTQQPWEKEVTFQVDMSNENISPDGVHIAGTFNGWDPAVNQMVYLGNNLYSTTLTLNENDIHQYRFVNGNTAEGYENVPSECGVSGNSGGLERQITIPVQDTTLGLVCFSSCSACIVNQVTLRVDMMKQTVSVYGVHLAGSFNNWNPAETEMTSSGSTVYEATVQVYAGDTISYRFVNGNLEGDMETVPAECGWIYNGQDYARSLVPVSDTVIETVCYNLCDPCDVGIAENSGEPSFGKPYPNPARSSFKMPVYTPVFSTIRISLTNLLGESRKAESFSLPAGYHELEIKTDALPEGLYLLNILLLNGNTTVQTTERMIITR